MDDKLRKRIEALLAMTQENGCTPAEAESAKRKAEELLTRLGVNESNYQMHHEIYRFKSDLIGYLYWKCVVILVRRVTNVFTLTGKETEYHIYGKKPYVDIATYILEVAQTGVERQIIDYKKRKLIPPSTTNLNVRLFMQGCIKRISQRILEIFSDNIDKEELLSAKNYCSTITKWKNGNNLSMADINAPAFAEGQQAGDKINLSKAVNRNQLNGGYLK
ncbi:DUF2786 domain-containing protein [Bartonella sp. DGB1]|uniref:DUF2786 domain-containing protein n=1 Tax=Bartonella sp. DGB1 TaxID=3239807 RepID=UPI00352596CE